MSESSDDPFVDPARPLARPALRDRVADLRVGARFASGRVAGVVLTGLVVAALAVVLWPRPASPAPDLALPRASTTVSLAPLAPPTTAASELVVDVVGEVQTPGLRRLAAGARIADVVQAAGGLTARADRARINLAAPVTDGERVFVPAVGQEVPPVAVGSARPASGSAGDDPSGVGSTTAAPVNINTATLDELDTLPGVGPATAQAIIDHRAQQGPFSSIDQLLDVRGIGDAKLAELRDRVTV